MISFRLKLLAAGLVSSIAAPAYAYIIPSTDVVRFQAKVTEDLNRTMEWMREQGVDQVYDQAKSQYESMKVDAQNNAIANVVIRKARALQEIAKIEQLSRATPSQDACQTVGIQTKMAEAACNAVNNTPIVFEALKTTNSLLQTLANTTAKTIDSLNPMSLLSENDGTSKAGSSSETASAKMLREHDESMFQVFDKYAKWEAEGKASQATDPSLLWAVQGATTSYTDEELQMAINQAMIAYPPYIRRSRLDPNSQKEIVSEVEKEATSNLVRGVVANQIAMRTAPSDTEPSELMQVESAAMLYLKDDGSLDADGGESWLHTAALDGTTTSSQNSRDRLIMLAIETKQGIEKLRSSLLMEQILAQMIRLETISPN